MTKEEIRLEELIDRYSPEVAATARAALKKLRKRFPGARLQVYDRPQSLPIGIVTGTGSPAISIVVYPRWVRFFFLRGAALEDPEGRLEGSGSQVRSIKLDAPAVMLDEPYIRALITQALRARP